MYSPPPYNTPMFLFVPTYETIKGVQVKKYPEQGQFFNGSFRTFGGTEKVVNNVIVVDDTATVETWYRPDLTADCRISIAGTNAIYEVIGEPENIEMRNKYLKFKVQRVKGGA